MKNITCHLESYRIALIAMWRQALSLSEGRILNWDVMDALDDAACSLFSAIVSIPIGMPQMIKTPSYERSKDCCDIIVRVASFDGAYVVSNNGAYTYYPIEKPAFEERDDLLFVDLFDFDVTSNRQFRFVSVVSGREKSSDAFLVPFSSCQFLLMTKESGTIPVD